MEKLMDVASYVFNRYYEHAGEQIDEMKLHKLLYFAQRESLIQKNEPLFAESFCGWKYGPVLKEIRSAYRDNLFFEVVAEEVALRIQPIMDKVFAEYADKDSWSLSRLTHGELSWKKSREGILAGENGDCPMDMEDIKLDALRVKNRRAGLKRLGLI